MNTVLSKTKETSLAIFIAAIVLGATSSDQSETLKQEQRHTAFMPAKPSIEQQVAYREEAREQLRLRGEK